VSAFGRWTLDNAQELYEKLKAEDTSAHLSFVSFDFSQLEDIDTSGAYLLARLLGGHDKPRRKWEVDNGTSGQMILMKAACEALQGEPPKTTRPWYDAVLRVGMASERFAKEVWETLAFIGHFFVVLGRLLLQPQKIRWKAVVALIEKVGLDAAPIVMVLSFFIGAVIAYMGANLLASFGASVFMVDLVGFSVLRELAPIITAIILAGRSDSLMRQ